MTVITPRRRKKMKKIIRQIFIIVLIINLLAGCEKIQTDIKSGQSQAVEEVITINLEGDTAKSSSEQVHILDGIINIVNAGTYRFVGEFDGQIHVLTEDKGQVQLLFAGVTLRNETTAPIYVEKAEEMVITLEEGTDNYIEDTAAYLEEEAKLLDIERTNGAIYSKTNLVINGLGTLSITTTDKTAVLGKAQVSLYDATLLVESARNGIKGKDKIYIDKGSIDIQAQEKAIVSDGIIEVMSGQITIDSVDDSMHSDDTIIVHSGELSLSTQDDGIHADSLVQVNGGEICIVESYEGIEAKDIVVNGGYIDVHSSDDGINISDNTEENNERVKEIEGGDYDYGLHINGGEITINSYGDGLDSNGNIWMNAGTVIVSGPIDNANGSIDYSGTFEMTGGSLIATGSSGMVQGPSEISSIPTMIIGFDASLDAGTRIQVVDDNEKILMDITAEKTLSSLVYSSIELKIDTSYNILINEQVQMTLELTDIVTSYGNIGGMGARPPRGERPQGERPQGDYLEGNWSQDDMMQPPMDVLIDE